MIVTITINTSEEELKRCIAAAWQWAYEEALDVKKIRSFAT